MRMARCLALTSICVFAGCEKEKGPAARGELRQVTGNTFEIIPAEGQLKHCLVFTRSETGVIRQLTMTHGNRSVPCEEGKPIGGIRYRVPVSEGPVKIHIFFSDQPLNAGALAQDLYERKGDPSFQPIDLRLPGKVVVQTLELQPSEAMPAQVGAQIGAGGAILPSGGDGGQEVGSGSPAAAPGAVIADGGSGAAIGAPVADAGTQ